MTRKHAKELLPILQAYAEGKTIQTIMPNGEWRDCEKPDFNCNISFYRIKQEENYTIEQNKEKHYRPFEDAAELILEYQNRFHVNNYCIEEPIIWVKKKVCSGDERSLITAYDINCVFIQDIWIDLTELFEKYTFLDGSVCGEE